jgi:hypothetical protein
MAELSYRHRRGPGKGREYPVAAAQYFHRRGGHFVRANAAGHVIIATTTSLGSGLLGWAEVPKDTAGKNSWKSSDTAAADSAFVIVGCEDTYEIPYDISTASANATQVGKGAACIAKSSTATHSLIQQAKYYATTASCNLIIEDYDKTKQTVWVRIKPDRFMLD